MRKDIHPENYREVIFKDMTNGETWLSRSTAASSETEKWEDGNEYPIVKLEISYKSHPFFTGKLQFIDTAGRIDKFRNKYAKFDKKPATPAAEATESAAPEATEAAAPETTESAAPEAPAEGKEG